MKDERIKAIIFLVISSILASTGGILIKLVDWNPIAIAGSRSLIASIVILIYLKKPKFTFNKAQVLGSIAYTSTVILFVTANKLTTSANAILLQYTSPIFVALLGIWILKEKIYNYDWVTMFIVFGGMILFFIDDVGLGNMVGNIFSIMSGFFFACVTISLRFQKDGSPVDTVLSGNVLTFLVAIPFILGSIPDSRSIIGLVLLGVFQTGFCIILYALAMKHIKAIEAALITVIEPLLNPMWVFIFSGEKPGLYAIIGGIIVLSSVTIRGIYVSRKPEKV
ncbi:MAG: DMT family transporter [Clostridiales bacterium]|nr:DMT family transporter [Clostridiales bacterium]